MGNTDEWVNEYTPKVLQHANLWWKLDNKDHAMRIAVQKWGSEKSGWNLDGEFSLRCMASCGIEKHFDIDLYAQSNSEAKKQANQIRELAAHLLNFADAFESHGRDLDVPKGT